MASASKTEMLENLREMLRDVLRLRTEGVAYAKLSRAHGYLDGYMRVLLETGMFSQKELLALISAERNLHDGQKSYRRRNAKRTPETQCISWRLEL